MNLKKFERLAGQWTEDAFALRLTPTSPEQKAMAAKAQRCAEELSRLISDTEDEMRGDVEADNNDYCLCDGCGLPIEPTKMFHSDRCVRRYSKTHAKDHGKDNEDE